MTQYNTDIQRIEDAISDLEGFIEGKCMLFIGEGFIESTEEEANEYCNKKLQVKYSFNYLSFYYRIFRF